MQTSQSNYSKKDADVFVPEEGDFNLVETWLRFDLPRVISGFFAGITAGIIMVLFAGFLCQLGGMEFLYPLKIPAAPWLGNVAFQNGVHPGVLVVGFLTHSFLCGVLGAIYAHFTQTNSVLPLLGAGFMWGTFSWIFISNLFTKSFQDIMAADIPAGPSFFVHVVFGLSLVCIRYFDRWVCGRIRK